MQESTAFICYYTKHNRNGFNALIGALETKDCFQDVKLYIFRKEGNLFSSLDSIVKRHSKVIIGFSFFTTQLWKIYPVIKKLKQKYGKRILCIAGGPHPTGDPLGTLRMGFDIVVRGEGEETFIELLRRLEENEDYEDVKGIVFMAEEGYHFSGWRKPVDLNSYPPFAVEHSLFGPIEITRGCPFACYFCQTPRIFGTKPRHRTVENICKYVKIMKGKNRTDIRFVAPNAFSYGSPDGKEVNIQALEELLESLRQILGRSGRIFFGSFPSEVRPEHVTEETLDLVMKYANNDNLIIGAQSGSQRILDMCHRQHSVEDVYNAVRLTRKAGLRANVDFIFGLPGETEKDVEITLKVIKDLVKMGAKIHVHAFMPLPQTPFAKESFKPLDKELIRKISRMISQGFAYGAWMEQINIARKIAEYLKTGVLK